MGKRHFHKISRNGQSLIEILVGIALAAVFVIGVATVIVPSLKINTQTEQIQTRTAFATELENNIRAWAAGNWPSLLTLATGTGNYYYLSTATSSFSVVTATTTTQSSSTVTETISFVQSTSTDAGDSLPVGSAVALQFAKTVSVGDLLIVGTYQDQGTTLTATDTLGSTFAKVATISFGNPGNDISLFVATTSVGGMDTIRVKPNGGHKLNNISIYEYSGTAIDSISNMLDASSTSSGDGVNVTTGNFTTNVAGDLVFGFLANYNSVGGNSFTYSSSYTRRELASGISRYCNTQSNCFAGEDLITNGTVTTAATGTLLFTDIWGALGVAIKPGTIIYSGSTLNSGTSTQYVGQSINVGTTTYYRYFNVNDVYRDSNGNVTTTTSGNTYYDPSTKKITVIVDIASSTLPQTSYTFYLTRNMNNALSQTSWAGGTATSTSVAFIANQYTDLSDITVSATGSLQLLAGGNSCVL